MLDQQRLIAYLAGVLDAGERARVETELAADRAAQRQLADQQLMDQALRVALGGAAADERVKQSVLAVVRATPVENLKSAVLEATLATSAQAEIRQKSFLSGSEFVRRCLDRAGNRWQTAARAWRGWFLPVSAAAVLAIVGVAVLFFGQGRAPQTIAVGQFAVVVGQPTMQRNGESSTLNAQPSTTIYLGDRIETGDADKAELVFKDGTTLRLGFNTSVEFPPLNSQPSTLNSFPLRPPEINLRRGQVWTKVQKTTNAPRYAVRTEAATAVARGTEFGVALKRPSTLDPQPSTSIAVLTVKEGAVDFSNALGSVQATAMTESTATPDSAPSQPILLKTIKQFDVGFGKQLNVEAQVSVFDLDEFMFRMVYPQGWAGIYVRSIPDEKDATVRQLRIVRVWSGSPAEQAGLAVGDVITRVNGQLVTKLQEVLRPIFQQQGASVALSLSRNGPSRTASLVTTNHPYAVPTSEIAPDLARDLVAATWPMIEAGCQEVISRNQWRELEQQFRNMLDRYPGAAAVHNNLGVWYEMNQEVGPAIQQLQQAIASDPNNPLYHYNLSRVLVSIGNFERCAEEAEAVVKLVPDWVPGVVQVAEAYAFLARPDDALAALERGLGANPSSAILWGVKAFVLLGNQKLDEALVAALRAAELEPWNARRFMTLGAIYWVSGQPQESEAAGRKAIELDPGYAEAYDGLAVYIIARLGNRLPEDPTDGPPEDFAIERWRDRPAEELAIIAEAERMGRKAIALNPNFVGAHVNLGNFLLLRGAVDEAEPILRKAAELDPNGLAANAYNSLAYRFAVWGIRLDEALQLAQRAVRLDPSGATSDTLAMVHFRRGEWEQAEAAWKNCIELGGAQGDPGASFHLGKLYELQNRPDAALAAYQEALRLRPDYPEVLRVLEKLRR